MDLDRRIVVIVREGPGSISLRHLCLILFPTFSPWELPPIAALVRWRCQELIRAGRLVQTAEDLFIAPRRRSGRLAQA
jgi:hypothetical protein